MSFCVMVSCGSSSQRTYENVRPVRDDPRRPPGVGAVDRPVRREDAREVELGDDLDDPGAAHARRPDVLEAGLVRPRVAADNLDARLERLGIDPDPLDGACRRALPAADLRSLEGRPRRARSGEQALAVTEHDLGIRADVDEER